MDAPQPGSSRCLRCFSSLTDGQSCAACAHRGTGSRSPVALALGTRLEHYHLGEVLGQPGGFGITYLAWDERLETRVAIKEFFPRDHIGRGTDRATLAPHTEHDATLFRFGLQQFLHEARTLARFDHPNIVRVRNFFEANGTGYLVMDYDDGQSLSAYLEQQPGERLHEELAIRILHPVLDGLRAVHAQGLLHRDVTPHNIYLTSQGRVILLDFGAARVAVGERSRSLSVILKPGYAPHEQYASNGQQGPWTDVYACAATLYRMVTGEIPPDALSRVMDDALRPARVLNPALSPTLSTTLASGLALRAVDRPQTVQEFQGLLSGTGGDGGTPPPRRRRKIPPAIIVPAGGAVVMGLMVLVAWLAPTPQPSDNVNRFRSLVEVTSPPPTPPPLRSDNGEASREPASPPPPTPEPPPPVVSALDRAVAMLSPAVHEHLARLNLRPADVLLHEDFSIPGNFSAERDEPGGDYFAVRNGRGYLLSREPAGAVVLGGRRRTDHRNVAVRADLRHESGDEFGGAGIFLSRSSDDQSSVVVWLNATGSYQVASIGAQWTSHVNGANAPASAHVGQRDNTLELIVRDRELRLFINGSFARTVTDLPAMNGGWIGLDVNRHAMEYSFDNLVAVELDQ